ncbi:MAG: prolyl oligopeptidase family serine peptidase, partial [Gammaproteobacteria bacterium]|nr:prolyl oligopeptidase family serine peptidase [Gammaproteobacteria bacterium]
FVGDELPSAHHWQQALATSTFPVLIPLSNFSGAGPRPVNESRALSYSGTYDMAGNAREWTSTAIGDEMIILGGNWNDPYYIAGMADASAPPLDRSPGNGFRLANTYDSAEARLVVSAPITTRSTASSPDQRQPVDDEIYAAYSRVFDYDRSPLNERVEEIDATRLWRREIITFDSAYGEDRVILHLYLPTSGSAPFQTVVYWSGWDTFRLDDVDHYFARQVDFIVKSGRALAFPVLRGTFARRIGDARAPPAFGTAAWRDNTIDAVKDIRRTIDYLEARADVDTSSLAYFGYSWGGVNAPIALAQEDRFEVAIIDIGLMPAMPATPEVDPLHSLSRIDVPSLMLSGEFDPMVTRADAEKYFEMIGVPSEHKRHVIALGGHYVPRELLIRESLAWLDRYAGPTGFAIPTYGQ